MNGLIVDLFAGGGGASTGIEAALGRPVDIAINHSPIAIAVHTANHAGTEHYTTDVFEVDPVQATRGKSVDLLWASPDCTHFSRAKGSRPDRPRSRKIRSLAWVIVRWARAVRPRVICMENVVEWLTWGPLDKDGQPVARRIGRTFREWCRKLEQLGYVIEWRELDASRYGAPTRRKRLFVVARCDGQPIRWPKPTHGPGLLPFRTAGECIDWSVPTRSIFDRERPLAEKTLHRIAEGIRRFVLENPRPYIVPVNHGGGAERCHDSREPLPTTTASRRSHALASPVLVRMSHGETSPSGAKRRGHGAHVATEPLPTVTASSGGGGFALAAPIIVEPGQRHPETGGRRAADEPLGTVVAKDRHALAVPYLVNTRNGEREGQAPRVRSIDDPAPTVTGHGSQGALGAAVLVKFRHDSAGDALDRPLPTITAGGTTSDGARPGGAPHALGVAQLGLVDMQRDNAPRSLDEPLGTITTQGNRFNELRAAFVAKHFGGAVGHHPERPLDTVTARDHNSLVAASLARAEAPQVHVEECRAFLLKYYSSKGTNGASLFDGLPTATSKARFGLVVVDGVEYEIADIYLRMLEPHELLRAQFGEHADGYDLSPARTKEAKTRLIGNSVCPHVAAALVRANVVESPAEVASA